MPVVHCQLQRVAIAVLLRQTLQPAKQHRARELVITLHRGHRRGCRLRLEHAGEIVAQRRVHHVLGVHGRRHDLRGAMRRQLTVIVSQSIGGCQADKSAVSDGVED